MGRSAGRQMGKKPKNERPKWPRQPLEWQELVNCAEFFRVIYDCQLYGLVTGPKINAERCDEILEEGHRRGFVPVSTKELIEVYLR
jgi:hypothetical protein